MQAYSKQCVMNFLRIKTNFPLYTHVFVNIRGKFTPRYEYVKHWLQETQINIPKNANAARAYTEYF